MMNPGCESAILRKFGITDECSLSPVGNGLIHTTLLVSTAGRPAFVLQRLNTVVFPDPAILANNAQVVTQRLRDAVVARGGDVTREVLQFLPARDGRLFAEAEDGSYWRLSHYVSDSTSVDIAGSSQEAGSVARAFASFLRDLWDLSPDLVQDAIPGFHDTPKRYSRYQTVLEKTRAAAVADSGAGEGTDNRRDRFARAGDLVEAILARADLLSVIESERLSGLLSTHICHNDTKVNNVLLDETSRDPLCVIDLDTIGRGSPLMDVGDLLRTAAATASEEEQDPGRVAADPEAALAIVHAFADVLDERLNAREHQLLPFSGWIITMEQCIRYLTDYLEGDVYYGERYPGHNLCRAQNQLALARSMEESFVDLRSIR